MIVPGRFIQEEDVPVCGDEHEAGETVETAQHDAQSPLNQKHILSPSNIVVGSSQHELNSTLLSNTRLHVITLHRVFWPLPFSKSQVV